MAPEPPIWFTIHARQIEVHCPQNFGRRDTENIGQKLKNHIFKLVFIMPHLGKAPHFSGPLFLNQKRLPSSPHKQQHLFPVGLSRGGDHHRSIGREEAASEIAVRLMIGQAFFLRNTWVAILCLDVPLEVR